jgi:hypothetical protein
MQAETTKGTSVGLQDERKEIIYYEIISVCFALFMIYLIYVIHTNNKVIEEVVLDKNIIYNTELVTRIIAALGVVVAGYCHMQNIINSGKIADAERQEFMNKNIPLLIQIDTEVE